VTERPLKTNTAVTQVGQPVSWQPSEELHDLLKNSLAACVTLHLAGGNECIQITEKKLEFSLSVFLLFCL